ncbi:MAG: fatty acid desaturase [Bryobacteraceae bacterium]|nr:fatty acid desaturase [Bryobacteraceae bacterium]
MAELATPIPLQKDTNKLNWTTIIAFTAFHILALITVAFFLEWKFVVPTAILYWICIGWGIGMGYHRLHTHRSYQAPKWMEYLFAVCGAMTLQGGPISWVGMHRLHHQFSDKEGDPHTPRDGKWWAHIIWMTVGDAMHNNTQVTAKYAPDLARKRFYVWLNDWHWVPLTVSGLLAWGIGWAFWGPLDGMALAFWLVFVRVTLGWHATWAVNSATHLWGSRRFQTRDDSRNNWWVALATFGEGWHNNHHAHQNSARHGLAWYELDVTWISIWALKKLGLVKNVKVAAIDERLALEKAA